MLGAVTALALLASLSVGGTPAVAAGDSASGRARAGTPDAPTARETASAKPAKAKPAKAKPAKVKTSGETRRLARNGYATHLDAEFVETTIRDHGTSGLILTVKRDPNLTPGDLTGIGFTIDLPQYVIVDSNDVDNTCTQATFTPDFGDEQLVVSGIEMASSQAQCTLGVAVTSGRSGTYTINDAAVTDTNGDIGAEITSDDLIVTPAPPRLTAYFDDDDIKVGETTDLTFRLYRSDENPGTVTSGIAWRLTLPAGLVVAATGNNTCGGTATGTVGSRIFTVTGGLLGAGDGSCEATVEVRATAGGRFELQSGTVTGLKKIETAFGACIGSVPDDAPDDAPGADATCVPTVDVEKLTQTVTFAQPVPRKVGDSTLTATASSGLPAGFTSSTSDVCTVVGNTLRVKTEGVCKVTAVQNGNGVYTSAHSEQRTIEILPRPPAPPTVDGVPGQSSITVSWTAPAETDAIVDYVASARSGDIVSSCTSATLTCVLGAVAGRPYTMMVVSRGPNGVSTVTTSTGTVTASAPIVPQAPPETDLDLTTTDGRITEAEPGQEITFVGTGFAPFSTVVITIYSKPTILGTAITDANGDFRKLVTVPSDLAAGAHTAVAQGVAPDGSPRAMALDITVSVDGLPVTGPGVATLLLMGAGAVVAGAGLMLAGRPRRRLAR
ncbi:hypothetical protein Acsp02_01490 [Actinoplanes sp. NBRC 103695]|nr:hypothetical protein Acsp02_01490 [Actinoplanes sp. NBRC 103695]